MSNVGFNYNSLATYMPPSAELRPTIVGTTDSSLKSVIGWLHRNDSWFEPHDSTTGGNNMIGLFLHS